jgi:hypothetical protein
LRDIHDLVKLICTQECGYQDHKPEESCQTQIQPGQRGKFPKFLESGVRDPRAGEVQVLEVLEPRKPPQAGVRDRGTGKLKQAQILESLEHFESGIRDPRGCEPELAQVWKIPAGGQVGVVDPIVAEQVDFHVAGLALHLAAQFLQAIVANGLMR